MLLLRYINTQSVNGTFRDNYGTGYFNIKDGAVLNLKGDKNHQQNDSRSLSMVNLQFTAGNDSKLVCNSQNPDVREFLTLTSCYFFNTQSFDIELYGNINWESYIRRNNVGNELLQNPVNVTPETFAADFRSMKIENAHPNGVFIGNVITVDNLDVAGNLNCDTLTANNTTLKAGSFVCTTDVMTLKNITVTEGGENNCVTLATEDTYKEETLYHTGEIRLQDSLNCSNNTYINFDKNAVNVVIKSTNYGRFPSMERYEAGAQIESNDVLASLSVPGGEPGQLLNSSSYVLPRDGFKTTVQQDESGNYVVKAVDITNGIYVVDKTTNVGEVYPNLTEVKNHIFRERKPGSEFEITLNTDTTAEGEYDLNYMSNDWPENVIVRLDLNGKELKLLNEQIVALDEIVGGGKLTLAAQNTIVPREHRILVNGVALKSNNTDLILGNERDIANSQVHIIEPGSGLVFKNIATYGDVHWKGNIDSGLCSTDIVTVTEKLTIKNIKNGEELNQNAHFQCKLTTTDMDMTEGHFEAAHLTVKNTLTTQTGRVFMVEPKGYVSLKDIHVISGSQGEHDGQYLCIELHRRVRLASEDNVKDPNFIGATEWHPIGVVTISGAVTADAKKCNTHLKKVMKDDIFP